MSSLHVRIRPSSTVSRVRIAGPELGFDVNGALYSTAAPAGLPQSAYILAQPIGWYRIPANVADILRSVTFGTEVVFDVMTQAEAISLEHAEEARKLAALDTAGATQDAQTAAKLNLTIDGERVIVDGVAQTTTSQLIREWTLATSPRVNGGWVAKGWRNGHCYSERRDTLADAVNGVVAQLKAAISGPEPVTPAKPKVNLAGLTPDIAALMTKWSMTVRAVDKKWRASATLHSECVTLGDVVRDLDAMMESGMSCPLPWHAASAAKASGYIITGDTKGTTTVMCSMIVTGDTVLISAPTADDMQALTMACYNAEHHPSIIIDGKNPPIFARIVTVECKHPDGPDSAECILTLKRSTAL